MDEGELPPVSRSGPSVRLMPRTIPFCCTCMTSALGYELHYSFHRITVLIAPKVDVFVVGHA